jgi:hypothetical protein
MMSGMGLLDWWRRRRGEVRAHAPSSPTGDDRFRADLERFVRPADGAREAERVAPAGDGAPRTFTTTVVTVNGRPVDPADPRAGPLLEVLQRIGKPGEAPDPESIRRMVEAFGEETTGGAQPGDVTPRQGIGARLAELESLRAAGLVSEAEYAEKRKQLLAEL